MDGGVVAGNAVTWSPDSFPRTAAYLGQLRGGLDGYPDCRAKASVIRKVYGYSGVTISGLPAPLQAQLDEPAASTAWGAQTTVLANILAIVESRRLEGEAERRFIQSAATQLFASPMYKILMWAASPRLVLKSAHLRWSAFFRGSELRSEVDDGEAQVVLSAPEGIFDEALAHVFTDVLYAALNYTRDENHATSLELAEFRPGRVTYHARY